MIVTATEFKTNFGKYLELISKEDIFITKNGKPIARMTDPNISAVDTLSGILEGKIPNDYDRKSMVAERLVRYETDD